MSLDTLRQFSTPSGQSGQLHSLPALKELGLAPQLDRLPVSIRIVLESLLRNLDGTKVTREDVENLARWDARSPGDYEIPFTVARIVLQDFTGVPLLVDLAAMRDAAATRGADPEVIEPLVPVDLVVDHSVQVDFSGSPAALERNMQIEFLRNRERYEFLKWGQQAFDTFSVVPPGIGIVHQVNLEYLAKGVLSKDGVYFPDTLVGTDSHTTMINGLGVVGWGVGGIEAEAGMLGQPVTFLVPEVVGVCLTGKLEEGVTATDLTLHVTQLLRRHGVVGKFVEFHGPGTRALSLPDRATIANMAPEYGATMGFFPVDEETVAYLKGTGRPEELCELVEAYYSAQGLFGIPEPGQCDYTDLIELDLSIIKPSVAGPKRPQDRIDVPALRESFDTLFSAPPAEGGFGLSPDQRGRRVPLTMREKAGVSVDSLLSTDSAHGSFEGGARNATEMVANRPTPTPAAAADADHFPDGPRETSLAHGSVLIAAITSCTNTSNPSVMLAAGLIAKKANALGLTVPPYVKTSLAPGSRVVTDYLDATGLSKELDQLGFQTVGYGCTTCIGNSGPLHPAIEQAMKEGDLICASVLSGNRNFEARVHGSIKANFLMSPPLVVAYALAGRVDLDLTAEPIGEGPDGRHVFLSDLWPTEEELKAELAAALQPEVFRRLYSDLDSANPMWGQIASSGGATYSWDDASTYIQSPPFFHGAAPEGGDITGARALGIFGDSVTTDHISPAGAIKLTSPAGRYLVGQGVDRSQFNSYGARRGNDRIMTRGTFANVRIKNLMCPGIEGGYTQFFGQAELPAPDQQIEATPGARPSFIYDAAMAYQAEGTPLIIIGGDDYGMGSSRDWAAKGTRLLGVQAVITKSFERIHRSNLIGMGVLPLNFVDPADYKQIAEDPVVSSGQATFDLVGLGGQLTPRCPATLRITRPDGSAQDIALVVRLDTPVEIDYYRAGGILPYVLDQILAAKGCPLHRPTLPPGGSRGGTTMSIVPPPRPRLWIWFTWIVCFYAGWVTLILTRDLWATAAQHWPIALAMALGSYAAGSTPMGGGTVGFPILVLLFDQPPTLGRDFSFAVQSVGMVSASVLIIARRQTVAWAMLKGAALGSLIGTPLGIFFIAPLIPGLWIKLVFAVLWGSFGLLHLWRLHEIAAHEGMTDFSERWDFRVGLAIGLCAGSTVASVTGVGIDMVLYTVLVLLCRADLKIAIPTSVMIMAFTSLVGLVTKVFFTGIEPGVFENWIAAAPVVALGAPLGVIMVAYIGRRPTMLVVAFLCVLQFLWTLHVERATLGGLGITLSFLALALCLVAFEQLRRYGGILVAQARARGGARQPR